MTQIALGVEDIDFDERDAVYRLDQKADGVRDGAAWVRHGKSAFTHGKPATNRLPPGLYQARASTHLGLVLLHTPMVSDTLRLVTDSVCSSVVKSITRFWDSKARYQELGVLHKRGILLWGPPASGKTSTLALVSRRIIKRGGIVFVSEDADMSAQALNMIREVEPDRPVIHILEDIDALIHHASDEHKLLAVLDGEQQIDNVVHIATTNFPEDLGDRFVKRPNRFDEVIEMGLPTAAARREYLQHVFTRTPSAIPLDKWVSDTQGFTFGHLRELAVSVYALQGDYEDALQRLRGMCQGSKRPTSRRGPGRNIGFHDDEEDDVDVV